MSDSSGSAGLLRCLFVLSGLAVVGPSFPALDVEAAAVTIDSDTFWREDDYSFDTLTIRGGSTLTVAGGSTIRVTGALRVSEGSALIAQGKNVGGMVGGLWSGEGIAVEAAELAVEAGSLISADGQGYVGGAGPGAGGSDGGVHGGSGGGYGGAGGRAGDRFLAGGSPYGDWSAPVDLGSGGGPTSTAAGNGGGAITLVVTGRLTLDGTITANGGDASPGNCFSAPGGGGGAGGSLSIMTATLAGSGRLSADGGTGADGGCFPGVGDDGGGGAGGRIAVFYLVDDGFGGFTTSSVSGGAGGGQVAEDGSMVFIDTANDSLRISQNLELPPDSIESFGALLVDDAATLTIGGGSILTIENGLLVTGSSILVLMSKNAGDLVDGEWQGTGVTLLAHDLQVDAGSMITAAEQGYPQGAGPGAGGSDGGEHGGAGGGHGGVGGRAGDGFNSGGPAYGEAFAPVELGSGGGPTSTAAGTGGGSITLEVTGTLTLDGVIAADGGDAFPGNCFSAPAGGGGAGGSIFITASTLAGTGTFTANGGNGADGGCFPSVGDDGGGGAGGRIAVLYDTDTGFAGFTTSSVTGGSGGGHMGSPGTLVFVDRTANALRVSQNLELPPDSSVSFAAVTVEDAATLTLGGGSILTVEGDFVVTGNSTIIARGKNASGHIEGEWQGAGVTINAGNARVDAGSAISADAQGYLVGLGPGAGGSDDVHAGAGAGHGGVGGRAGDNFNDGGSTYGDAFAPVDLGSGGGPAQAAAGVGGGAIELNVAGTLTLNGTITANGSGAGSIGCSGRAAGGGSGGSIFVRTDTLAGQGPLLADGGTGGIGGCSGPGDDGGGGAGGRIAVLYANDGGFGGFTTSSVNGAVGGGRTAPPGTMAFVNTATNALRVSQNLDFAEDSSVTFGALTVDDEATLTLGGGTTLTVENDVVVTGQSTVIVRGKNRDGRVSGEWQGAGVTIYANNVFVDPGSVISADAQGYLDAQGPGVGNSDALHPGGGGGHGGVGGPGGDGFNAGGPTYGSEVTPLDLGSGGGPAFSEPGIGGGALAIYAADTFELNGLVTAGGSDAGGIACSLTGSGGGSGGSILIGTTGFAGQGSLKADGGRGGPGGCTGGGDDGGGGGGDRIAIYYSFDEGFAGFDTSTVDGGFGGIGQPGSAGTIVTVDCTGDCNADRRVTIDEIVRIIDIGLGNTGVTACLAGDERHDGAIVVNEIVRAVDNALGVCLGTRPK